MSAWPDSRCKGSQVDICVLVMANLYEKLRLDAVQPLLCINLQEPVSSLLAGVDLHPAPVPGVAYRQALFFCLDQAGVEAAAAHFPALDPACTVWAAYPKAGPLRKDLNRDKGWDPITRLGFLPVSQISVNDGWAALWFKNKDNIRTLKRAIPMEERITEGVDYVARTVSLPDDVLAQLHETDPVLIDVFRGMSFSHQREYAEAIAEAKKPETRLRRITKMAEALEAWRLKKQKK